MTAPRHSAPVGSVRARAASRAVVLLARGAQASENKKGNDKGMELLALLLLGTLTGNELAVSAFVHPTLSRLPDEQHAASAQGIARVYGKYAPFWYGATLLTLIALAWRTPSNEPGKPFFGASAVLMVAVLIFTLVGPVPINNRVSTWDLNNLPSNWKDERSRWDRLHAIRVAMLLVSLVALVLGTTHK